MKKIVIAIVEDDADDQDFLRSAIEETKKNIITKNFNNGREFLSYIKDADKLPDIVITDLRMPYVTGWEVIANLKSQNKTQAIPIAILSTSASQNDKDRAALLGTCGYHVKPQSPHEYRHIVELIMQNCRA